jgi:hypothetical protein
MMQRLTTYSIVIALLLIAPAGFATGPNGVSFLTRSKPGVSSVASTYLPKSARRPNGAPPLSVRPVADALNFGSRQTGGPPRFPVSQLALHCLTQIGGPPSLGAKATLAGLQCLSVPVAVVRQTVNQKKGKHAKPPAPSVALLARLAMDRAIALAGEPGLELAPSRVGLTGLDTYFWIAPAPRPIAAQARVPGVALTARARPVQYLWTFGDGTHKVTSTAGRPWTPARPGTIAHQYQARSRYTVTVQIVWSATWRIGSGEWRTLGTFATRASRPFPVREAVAALVKS